MPAERVTFYRPDVDSKLKAKVEKISKAFLNAMNEDLIQKRLLKCNVPKASSQKIQECFEKDAIELGFRSEAKGLFSEFKTQLLRPDFYLPLGDSGILLEVERGKTTKNNMDLLDFWKCHLCTKANFLFLVVPMALKQNDDESPKNEFKAVSKRLSSFFQEGTYTNVYGLTIFGY